MTIPGLGFNVDPCLVNPLPLIKDYNRDPNMKALKRRGCINHGSTLPCKKACLGKFSRGFGRFR